MHAFYHSSGNLIIIEGNMISVMEIAEYEAAAMQAYGDLVGNLDVPLDDLEEKNGWIVQHDIRSTYSPRYDTMEAFINWVGREDDDLGIVYDPDNGLGHRLLWFYDNRDHAPLPKDQWTDEERSTYDEDGIEPDPVGGNFGYVLNLDVPVFSEWGIAPYPARGQSAEDYNRAQIESLENMMNALGPDAFVVDMTRPEVETLGQLFETVREEFKPNA